MRSNSSLLKVVMLLSVIGALISLKLLSIHIRTVTGQVGFTETCGIGSATGCFDIAASKYSDLFGIPLASVALGTYLAYLLLGFLAIKSPQGSKESIYTMFLLSTIAVVVTVVMFVISNYVLRQFCEWCAMLWVVNLAIWPLLVLQLGLGWGNALAGNLELLGGRKENLRAERVRSALIAAVACVGIAALGSVVVKANNSPPAHAGTLVADWDNAPIVMLPAEAFGGPTSKGFSGPGSPVMEIAEMADFQCPACKMAGMALRTFVMKHKDKVRLTYHHFPLDGSCNPFAPNGGHRLSCAAAKGSMCAANQGKFWEFHDNVFDKQESLTEGSFAEFAKAIGLDMGAYEACLKDPATETALQKNMQLGETIGLQSTPTIVINGRKMIGGRPPAELESLLEHIERITKK